MLIEKIRSYGDASKEGRRCDWFGRLRRHCSAQEVEKMCNVSVHLRRPYIGAGK